MPRTTKQIQAEIDAQTQAVARLKEEAQAAERRLWELHAELDAARKAKRAGETR